VFDPSINIPHTPSTKEYKMAYYSTKTYGHNIGLSAVFRQPNADHSHCHLLHGYSWAVDFGGLKALKKWLEDSFDHKTVIDREDPFLYKFAELEAMGLCEITLLDGVGTERFAYHAWKFSDDLVKEMTNGRCWVESVECAEHGANSSIYTPFTVQRISFANG
jgi:6-pyruvoyltetrahydropterin/6-carboxytetrahydropterin synthase